MSKKHVDKLIAELEAYKFEEGSDEEGRGGETNGGGQDFFVGGGQAHGGSQANGGGQAHGRSRELLIPWFYWFNFKKIKDTSVAKATESVKGRMGCLVCQFLRR